MSKPHSSTPRLLLFPFVAAFALASPAVFAQSHGVGIGAGVNASAAARVPTQMPAQASAGMEMRAMQRAEPQQKATPAVPATPAIPAVPASKSDDGKATPAAPATPAVPATPAEPAANTDGKQARKDWSALDTDGNGSLSVSEAASLDSLAKVFAQADADGNGELTGEEYKVWWAANAGAKAGKR